MYNIFTTKNKPSSVLYCNLGIYGSGIIIVLYIQPKRRKKEIAR